MGITQRLMNIAKDLEALQVQVAAGASKGEVKMYVEAIQREIESVTQSTMRRNITLPGYIEDESS